VKTYRHKHGVEAMRWTGTPEDRARFTEWFGGHDIMFKTHGSEIVLPAIHGYTRAAAVGAWILHADGEFLAMEDAVFTATYEEVAKTLETAKTFGPGLAGRAALVEYLKGVDPAKALLVWIRTAVDTFLRDTGAVQNAVEGWDVFLGWVKGHRGRPDLNLESPAERVLQRITARAEEEIRQAALSRPVADLRVVEPWIDEFFTHESLA